MKTNDKVKEKVDIKQIEGSAKFGKLMSTQAFALFLCTLWLFVVVDIGFVIEAFFPFEQNCIGETVAIAIGLVLITAIPAVFVIKELLHRGKIKSWIQDAVRVTARVVVVDHTPSIMLVSSTSKVAVNFCYNNEQLNFTSGKFSQLDSFAGNNVIIAYSPTYKQVMFLKCEIEIV